MKGFCPLATKLGAVTLVSALLVVPTIAASEGASRARSETPPTRQQLHKSQGDQPAASVARKATTRPLGKRSVQTRIQKGQDKFHALHKLDKTSSALMTDGQLAAVEGARLPLKPFSDLLRSGISKGKDAVVTFTRSETARRIRNRISDFSDAATLVEAVNRYAPNSVPKNYGTSSSLPKQRKG